MENFFHNDDFYHDVDNFLDQLEIDEKNVNDLPEDYTEEIEHTTEEKIFQVDINIFIDAVMNDCQSSEDRFPEDTEGIDEQIKKAIIASIDIAKLNELLPSLHYMNGIKETFTKSDFVNFCK